MKYPPDFTRPADPQPDTHCKRCHRNIPGDKYPVHYRNCPGFKTECEDHPHCDANRKKPQT